MLATDLFLACSQALSPWFYFASVGNLVDNRHSGTSEMYRGSLQIIYWTCDGARGCESCFLSGSLNAAARGHVCR